MSPIYFAFGRVIARYRPFFSTFYVNQTLDPVMLKSLPHVSPWCSALFCAVLTIASLPAVAQQEWAYHEPNHLDHSHVLVDASWGTDRIVAAVAHTGLGTYNSGTTSTTPEGTSILIRQKDDGTILWEVKLASDYLLRLSDMKVVPGTDSDHIAIVGHRRLSLTGTFSDRGVLFIVDASDGSLIHQYSLDSTDPANPVDSRLLGIEFYNHQGVLNMVCTGWSGDVTSTGGNHRGLYLRFSYSPSAAPTLLDGWELNSPTNGPDHDYIGKAVDIGSGIAVVGSTNPYDFNGDIHQAAMAALFDYDGSPLWGQGYREFILPAVTDHTVTADILKIDGAFVMAMNHFNGQSMSVSSFNPANGELIHTRFIDVPSSMSTSENIKAFDLEENPNGGWILGGYLKNHEWIDPLGVSQKGNIPYFLTGSVDPSDGEVMPADMKALRVPSNAAGETVNNWAYAPFPNDHEQPWVFHPEMMTREADQDANVDLILTGYRERPFNPSSFSLNITPTDFGISSGPCDPISIPYLTALQSMESFDIPPPSAVDLEFNALALDPIDMGLTAMDCGVLMPPPVCSLPTNLSETIDCLDLDIKALGGFTPPVDVMYDWDFGDGTTLTGTNLDHPPVHTYASAGTYVISLTAHCVFDPATSTTLQRTVTMEECGGGDGTDPPCSVGPFTLDFWMFCGPGCYGTAGTRSATSIDGALWDLDEAEYDAALKYSDGTTVSLDLNSLPQSFVKCFSSIPFVRSVCLVVYEEGGEASGAAPCYEVCASDACIHYGPLPGSIRDLLLPELAFSSATGACSIDIESLPDTIETEVSLRVFDTPYPGGGDEASFLDAFMAGEDFANEVAYSPIVGDDYGYSATGDGGSTLCYQSLEATVTHPVVVAVEEANGVSLYFGGNVVEPSFLADNPHALVLTLPKLQVNTAILTETVLPFLPEEGTSPLVMVDPSTYSGAIHAWSVDADLQGLSFSGTSDNGDLCDGILAQANQQPQVVADGLLTYASGTNAQLNGFDSDGLGFMGEDIDLVSGTATCPSELNFFAEYAFSTIPPQYLLQGGEDLGAAGMETRAFQLLTTMDASAESGAPTVSILVEFSEGYGDGFGAFGDWTLEAANGTTVAAGSIPSGVTNFSEEVMVPAGGSYTFSVESDCWAAVDASVVTVSLISSAGPVTLLSMPFNTLPPGLGIGSVDIPGVVISPANTFEPDSLCNAVFTHDMMQTGAFSSWPYEVVAAENNILLSFAPIDNGTGTFYRDIPPWNSAVFSALPLAGAGQVLLPGPTTALYDFTAFSGVQEVSFVYFDGAGYDNLMVNGHQLYVGEIESMPSSIAPGVTLSVNSTRYPGYEVGLVTLTGDVQTLQVGGIQMYLDNICVKFNGQVVDPFSCDADCDALFDFEDLPLSNRYGDPGNGANVSTPPGAPVSTIDGVTMSLVPLYSAQGSFNYVYLQSQPATVGPTQMGSGQRALLGSISARFDIQPAFSVTDTVCVSFGHEGSLSNFSVNGSPVTILTGGGANAFNNLQSLHGSTIGGVAIEVSSVWDPVEDVRYGVLTMIGDVDEFDIGGDELYIDDVCISASDDCSSDPANYFLEVEEVTSDVGVLSGGNGTFDLTGYATYRLWMNVDDASDFISGVYGTDVNPTLVESTGSFFHASLGAVTPNNIDPSFLPVFPELAYDSWVSIGLEQEPDLTSGEGLVGVVTANTPSWTTEFDPGSGGAGSGVLIDAPAGAGWFSSPGDVNAIAGANQKVLLGQFTTNGDLSGQLYVTVHPCGNAEEAFSAMYPFGSAACADSDGDGVCDEDEIAGCTQAGSSNYNPEATDDDGSCATNNTGLYLTGGTSLQVECDGMGNPADLAAWLNANGGVNATTGCLPVTWSHDFTALSNGCGNTGAADVTFSAVDACGNAAAVTLTFAIVDVTAPTLSVPTQIAANCGTFDPTDVSGVTASDVCGGVTLTAGDIGTINFGCVTPVGTYTRTITAVDECGNSSERSQIIVLEDVYAPLLTLTCPPDTTLVPDANCNVDFSPFNTGTAVASVSDDCDAAPSVTVTHSDVMTTTAGVTTITRTWTAVATDHCGNSTVGECIQVILIEGCDDFVPGNTGNADDCTAQCDEFFGFEDLSVGDRYGDVSEGATIPTAAGSVVAIANGIPMYIDSVYSDVGTGFYGYLESTLLPSTLGAGQKAQLVSCAATFDIEPAIPLTDTICIAYEQQGGDINFSVNGSPLFVDAQFVALDGDFVNGVNIEVSGATTATGFAGTITLIGDVNTFTIGGFELIIDEVCISEDHPCDISFTHESMAVGAVNTANQYLEDGLVLSFGPFDNGTFSAIGSPYIDWGVSGAGSGQVLWLDNTNAHYNLSGYPQVSSVDFDYADGGGDENLSVNGASLFLEFADEAGVPFSLGGVDVLITRTTGFSESTGKVYLIGAVSEFSVGGEEFYVDNVCVTLGPCSADTDGDGVCDEDEVAGCTNPDADNFNPDATDDDGSCDLISIGACATDVDDDGVTGIQDLLLLLGNFSLECE